MSVCSEAPGRRAHATGWPMNHRPPTAPGSTDGPLIIVKQGTVLVVVDQLASIGALPPAATRAAGNLRFLRHGMG